MAKKPVRPATREEMLREYPLEGFVKDWFFKKREISAGVWLVEGSDIWGRKVSCKAHKEEEVEAALNECIQYAQDIRRQAAR